MQPHSKIHGKGVFLEEICEYTFNKIKVYLGTHLHKCDEKRVNFDVHNLTFKNKFFSKFDTCMHNVNSWIFIFTNICSHYCFVFLLAKMSVFYSGKRVILSITLKIVTKKVCVLMRKWGLFLNWRTRMGAIFICE